MRAKALYKYVATEEQELNLIPGQLINIIETDDDTQDGWWMGRDNNGHVGYFPSSYVKITNETDEVQRESMMLAREIEEQESKRITMVVVQMHERNEMGAINEETEATQEEKGATLNRLISRKQSEWEEEEEKEFLKKKEKILVKSPSENYLSKEPERWTTEEVAQWIAWLGYEDYAPILRKNDISGEALLEMSHEVFREMQIKSIGKRIKILNAIKALKEAPVQIQAPVPILEEATTANGGESSDDSVHVIKVREGSDCVKALSSHKASKEDELSFSKDDMITVLERTSEDMWKGELNGKIGLFPKRLTEVGRPSTSSMYSTNTVSTFSGIDAVSPDGVKSVHNRRVKQKDIKQSQKQSRKKKELVEAPVPNIKVSEIKHPDYDGFLYKQGGSFKNWRRRWFVLKGPCLYYFKDATDGQAIGCVTLPSYEIASTKEVSRKFAFKAYHASARTYFFAADTQSDMELWINALKKVITSQDEESSGSEPKASEESEEMTTQRQPRKPAPPPPEGVDPRKITRPPPLPVKNITKS